MSQDSWLVNNLGAVLLLSIVAVVILSIVGNYWLAPMIFQENRDAGEKIADNTIDESAVQDYRWFRQQWNDIQSQREIVENFESQHDTFHNSTWPDDGWKDTKSGRERHSEIHMQMTGSKNNLERMIGEYNARQQDATRALFNCGLPYNIDEKLFIADASGVEYTSEEAASKSPPEDIEQCEFSGEIDRDDE